MKLRSFTLLIPLLATAASAHAAAESADPAGLEFFEKKIRPVLVEKCYKCHAADSEKIKGGLVLDTREGIRRGGDNGPAVVPGSLQESLLIEAVRYHNKDFAMPPEKSGGKLPEAVIADFEKWVKLGAPDPRDGAAKTARKQDAWEAAKDWWAWQPVRKPSAPPVQNTAWPRGDIDKFVLAGLEAKKLKPVADADPLTLARRIYFDLTGLPPSPKDAAEFQREWQAAGADPKAVIGRLVDRLLATPQFGERWGRHWLDVARYAESTGKEANVAFPHAWRYRDYVINAFNANKPFDQFIREQLAGDLLSAGDSLQETERKVATGFLAIGSKGLSEQNPRQFALDLADEQIDTVSQAFLGMTVACARCHDHKFDPISQKEYYALAGIFLSTDTKYGTPRSVQNRHPSGLIELPGSPGLPVAAKPMSPQERAEKQARLEALQKEQQEFFAERFGRGRDGAPPRDPRQQQRRLQVLNQSGALEAELKGYDQNGQPKALAMGVQDLPAAGRGLGRFGGPRFGDQFRARFQERFGGARPPEFSAIGDSALYARGEPDKPGEKVPRGFLQILSHGDAPAIPKDASGRRELADWIASPQNPLAARVFVNRAWHWLFGQGIVSSPDNFGTTGAKPSNPELLDYLASRFMENGWSVKTLVKEIITSRAYALASVHDEANFAADPQNALVWRANERRLDAECIRDAMLAASGQLQAAPPVGSLIGQASDGPIGGPRFFRGISEDAIVNSSASLDVRSVYLPIARDVLPEALSVFDFPEPSLVAGARETTNVPSQALYMLNSATVARCAQKLAGRVLAAIPGGANGGVAAKLPERVQFAYWTVFSRPPTDVEQRAAFDFFGRFPGAWQKGDARVVATRDNAAASAAWASFCRALFASAEFRLLN